MSSQRRTVAVLSLLVLLLAVPIQDTYSQTMGQREDTMIPADIEILQVISDPKLETEPTAYIRGSTGEFQHDYFNDTMELVWDHDESTSIGFVSEEDVRMPGWSDYVYFVQSFDWPYDQMPNDAELRFNYSVSTTGGFTNTSTHNMFGVYAWLIDSSSNWWTIYRSSSPYYSIIQEYREDLHYFDIAEGWRGMIEDESGVQEDPSDVLTLGIGLAPTPELNLSIVETGSIVVEVTDVEFHVILEIEPEPGTFLSPLYNATYGSKIGDTFPFVEGALLDGQDTLYAMTTDAFGNVYVTGQSSTGYELYSDQGLYGNNQFLIKYSPSLRRVMFVRNQNLTNGRAITIHDGHIYTSGFIRKYDPIHYNLILTKWTMKGVKIWQKEWGGSYDQVGVAIGVHDDGSIYVMASDYNLRGPEGEDYYNSSLMKYDPSGELLWNRPVRFCTTYDYPGELYITDTRIYYFTPGVVMCMDLEGELLWDEFSQAAVWDTNGNTYTAEVGGGGIEIACLDADGNQTWTEHYSIEYPNGWVEFLTPCDISLSPHDDIVLLIQSNFVDYGYHVLKFNLNGTLIREWSVGNEAWPYSGGSIKIEVAPTGLLYVAFTAMSWDAWVQGYVIGPYTQTEIIAFFGIGAFFGVIVIIMLFIEKKKNL